MALIARMWTGNSMPTVVLGAVSVVAVHGQQATCLSARNSECGVKIPALEPRPPVHGPSSLRCWAVADPDKKEVASTDPKALGLLRGQ